MVVWMVAVVVVSLMGWYEKEDSTMEGKERRICVCSQVLSAPFSDVAERKGTAVVSPFPPTGMRSCDKRSGLHKGSGPQRRRASQSQAAGRRGLVIRLGRSPQACGALMTLPYSVQSYGAAALHLHEVSSQLLANHQPAVRTSRPITVHSPVHAGKAYVLHRLLGVARSSIDSRPTIDRMRHAVLSLPIARVVASLLRPQSLLGGRDECKSPRLHMRLCRLSWLCQDGVTRAAEREPSG